MAKILIKDTKTLQQHLRSNTLCAKKDSSVFYRWTKGEWSTDLVIQKFMENNRIELTRYEIDRRFFEKWLKGLGF